MKKAFLKKLSVIVVCSAAMASCSTNINMDMLVGEWRAVDIYHPFVEEEYEVSKKIYDTMTVAELGDIAMYGTNDVEVIKKKELATIEKRYITMKEQLLNIQYHFLKDSVLLRSMNETESSDSIKFQIIDKNRIVLKNKIGNSSKLDTVKIVTISQDKLKIEEPFLNKNITTTFERIK